MTVSHFPPSSFSHSCKEWYQWSSGV